MKKTLILAVLFFNYLAMSAAEFPWFKVGDHEGWVELTGSANGQKYIKILPFVTPPMGLYFSESANPFGFNSVGPGTAPHSNGLEITADNRLKFGYKVISDPKFIPPNLKRDIAHSLDISEQTLANHIFSIVKVRNLKVEMYAGGKLIRQKSYNTSYVSGDIRGAFYFDFDADYQILNSIRAGDFELRAIYEFPYSNFSSIEIVLDNSIITKSWVKVFRKIVKQISSSRGSFLFFNWSSSVQRVYVEENIRSKTTNQMSEDVSVIMRDPTPEQRERFETLLGYVKTTGAQVIAQHTAAYNNAVANNKLNLAEAHKQYLENLQHENPADFKNDFLEKLAALAEDEVLGFLAAGIKIGTSNTSSYFSYNGSSSMQVNSSVRSEYREYIIKNSFLTYTNQNFKHKNYDFNALYSFVYESLNQRYFGKKSANQFTHEDWKNALKNTIRNRDLFGIKYVVEMEDEFTEKYVPYASFIRKDLNVPLDGDGNRPVHLAIDKADMKIIKYLVSNGANPNLTNRYQESGFDMAESKGIQAISDYLEPFRNAKGSITINIAHPPMDNIVISWISPDVNYSVEKVNNQKTVITIEDFPMKISPDLTIYGDTWVSQAQLSTMRNPTILSYNQNYALIKLVTFARKDYKIKQNTSITYEQKIVFEVTPKTGMGLYYFK